MDVDVLIVGGGPAGASAALILARCRRSVLLCDDGKARNRSSSAIHGLVIGEGMPPEEYRALANATLSRYSNVRRLDERASAIVKEGRGFSFRTASRSGIAKSVLLATGLVDELPELSGLENFYGHSVHHCLYCDAYEIATGPSPPTGKARKASI